VKQRLGKFGSTLAFEFYLKTIHAAMIEGIRKYLTSIKPEDIPAMIRENRFPPLEHLDLSAVSDNSEHLERITPNRLIDFIAEARPDLITAIQDMGIQGGEYIIKLRQHLLNLVKHPEKSMAKSIEYKPEDNIKLATCDKCGKSFPGPEDVLKLLDKCPFCGVIIG